jgi:glutaconyl-CoA/methylmalonyl-CoA decarboxylase subunit gamma
MNRHLRITLNGRVYEVMVEEVVASTVPSAAASTTAAETTTMTPMPGPYVPPAKPAVVAAPTPAQSAPVAGGPDDRTAPLAGVIAEIMVKVGDSVAVDDALLVLEAMKMKTVVGAHKAGRVVAVLVSESDAVDADQPLVTIA